jgi:hypothetical protein
MRAQLDAAPTLALVLDEAEALDISFTALLALDLLRLRALASAAEPVLTTWQWEFLGRFLRDFDEQCTTTERQDIVPEPLALSDEIRAWAAGARSRADEVQALELSRLVLSLSPIALVGVLMRLRIERNIERRRVEKT